MYYRRKTAEQEDTIRNVSFKSKYMLFHSDYRLNKSRAARSAEGQPIYTTIMKRSF